MSTTTGRLGRAATIHIGNSLYSMALRGLAIAFAICLLFQQAIAAATYPVVDAGYRLARHGKLYWLDNNRVLFYGGSAKQDSQRAGKVGGNSGTGGTYVWNLTTGMLEHLSEWEITCYHPDYATWSLVRSEKNIFRSKAGKFGQETELPREELTAQQRMDRVRSDITCKTHLRSELAPPAPLGRRIIVLREGDGYLDSGPEGTIERGEEIRVHGPGHIALFRPGAASAINLPMTLEQGPGSPIYSEYGGTYVTRPRPKGSNPGRVSSWPRGMPFTVYSFKATGETTEIILPYGEWGDIAWIQPTRAGWIFSGNGEQRPKSGLYIFGVSQVRRLDTGQVFEIAVSPNGCRAAVGIQNRHLEMGTPINLKTIDLCAKEQ